MIEKELIKDITEKYLEGTTMFLVDVVVKPGNAIVVEVDSDEGVSIDESKDLLLQSDKAPRRSRTIPGGTYRVQKMLFPIFQKGELVYQKPDLKTIMAYADQQVQTLWPEYLRLVNPEEMWVQRSSKLSALRDKVLKEESAHFF